MKYGLLFGLFVLTGFASRLCAQAKEPSEELSFSREFALGGGLHTKGFHIGLYHAWLKTPQRSDVLWFEVGEIRSHKERRQSQNLFGPGLNSGRSYLFGKRNNFYTLRLGWGQVRAFSDRQIERSAKWSYLYQAGLSLGVLKPYHLTLAYRDDRGILAPRIEAYSEDNAQKFLDPSQIDGPGGFQYGWNQLSFQPGLGFKLALRYDWGEWDQWAKSLEIGLSTDLYASRVPIMILQGNQASFFNFYLHAYFGGRW